MRAARIKPRRWLGRFRRALLLRARLLLGRVAGGLRRSRGVVAEAREVPHTAGIAHQLDLRPRYMDAEKYSLPMYLIIGFAQCLAMVPGVSRAGATIVAAMLLGGDRRSAAEFSFWLAMPTMFGAFVYDLYKSRGQMSLDNGVIIAIGFAVSFVAAWIVVKTFLGYVQRHGFALFAWWRVVVGTVGLIALALGY